MKIVSLVIPALIGFVSVGAAASVQMNCTGGSESPESTEKVNFEGNMTGPQSMTYLVTAASGTKLADGTFNPLILEARDSSISDGVTTQGVDAAADGTVKSILWANFPHATSFAQPGTYAGGKATISIDVDGTPLNYQGFDCTVVVR